jgi:hypothetical protein
MDGKIEHYRRMSMTITDQPILAGIKQLTEKMEAQKAALHAGQAPQGRPPGGGWW